MSKKAWKIIMFSHIHIRAKQKVVIKLQHFLGQTFGERRVGETLSIAKPLVSKERDTIKGPKGLWNYSSLKYIKHLSRLVNKIVMCIVLIHVKWLRYQRIIVQMKTRTVQ